MDAIELHLDALRIVTVFSWRFHSIDCVGSIWEVFVVSWGFLGMVMVLFWNHFRSVWRPFWDCSEIILGSFWDRSGIVFGCLGFPFGLVSEARCGLAA